MSRARYKQQGSIYATTLAALYGSDTLTIYPLHVTDKLSVLALFAANVRAEIIPILKVHDYQIKIDIGNAAVRLEKASHVFDKRSPKRFNLGIFNQILDLKPNFCGIGININAIFEKIMGRQQEKMTNVQLPEAERKLLPPG